MESWDDEDEMGVASAFVMGVLIGSVSIGIISAAIIWNAASVVAEAVRKVRG
jgi:hypothetical protein